MGYDAESIALRPDPSELGEMREFVSGWATRHGVPAEAAFTACLLATEAVTNAMRHARNPDGAERPITVSCVLDDDDLVVAVTDNGRFSSRRDRNDDHGGRGLFIISELTSGFELESRPEGTRLAMRLPFRAGALARTPTA